MNEFPATDVALEGFRLTREHPRAVAVWASVRLAFTLLVIFAMNAAAGPQVTAFLAAVTSGAAMDELTRAAEPLLPTLMAIVPFDMAVQAILAVACFRAVLTPQSAGRFYLGFGADELRVLALNLLGFFVLMLASFAATLLGRGVSLFAGAAGGAGSLIDGAYFAVVVATFGYVAVRVSLVPALSVLEGRFALGSAWRLTAGRHWLLAGVYVMAVVLGALVYVLGAVIGSAFQVLDGSHDAGLMSPATLLSAGWMAVVGVLINVVLQAPGAAAVLTLIPVRRAD
jgi:hypothetical protein